MPPRTMLKFWAVMVIVPALVLVAAYGMYSRSSDATAPVATATASEKEELAKDAAVQTFIHSPMDQSKRRAGLGILREDILLLGSSADPAHLPQLVTILRNGEPVLRAAAASAIGMIRPGASEIPPLRAALNDPIPAIRNAALGALEQAKDASTQLLVRRAQTAGPGTRPQKAFEPQPVPDAEHLGVPVYAGATFLHFASDQAAGRVAFSTPDSMQKVLEFYTSKAGRPGMNSEEFAQQYFGGSAPGSAPMPAPAPANTNAPTITIPAPVPVPTPLPAPLSRYAEQELYGTPTFVALRETSADGIRRTSCFAVIFADRALAQTGFELSCGPELK
jgi:hypothetical protein